jgi:V/A-type H+-transporting ATPase subunit I
MVQIHAVILKRDEHAVLQGLGHLGAVQLAPLEAGPDTAPLPPPDRARELARCGRIRTRVEAVRGLLGKRSGAPQGREAETVADRIEMTLDEAEEKLGVIEHTINDTRERRQAAEERRKEVLEACTRSSHYKGLDIPLDSDDRFSFLHFVTGRLPADGLEELRKKLDVEQNAILFPLGQYDGWRSIVAVSARRGRMKLGQALEEADFRSEVLPLVRGATVDTLCEEGEKEQRRLTAEAEALQDDLNRAATEFERPLREIDNFADAECCLIEAGQRLPRTDAAVLITGWAPEDVVPVLEQRMKEITGGFYALETNIPDAEGEDRVPVLLHHSWLLRPFETLVSTYGLPRYRELEPTLFVAVSYVLMFGLMFGDAGHGLVLAAGGLLILARGQAKFRDPGLLLLFAGLSSMVFGAVYGSCFGVEALKKYAIWHDPLEGDPIRLMLFTIGFGIVMISLGLALNVINRFRRADVIGGLLDKFGVAGLLFYWGALGLLAGGQFFESHGLTIPAFIVFLVVPMISWVVKEPLEHILAHRDGGKQGTTTGGMAEAVTESLVGAFEAVLGYLANTISFVRLAAYAMSHAALLVAAFMLAAQVREFPLGGSFWSVGVIILGNVVAIVLEGIIASVQALRLEYYEFFGKFFSGSGRPFEPFRLAGRRG